ncbi:MAG: hypothetical protein ACYC9L_00820 [Sulfuricaulis sp.]
MQEILLRLVDVPIARMFVLAAIIFLLIAVLGRIEGKIEPGKLGRIGATIIGLVLMGMGLAMYFMDGEIIKDKLREKMNLTLDGQARPAGDIADGNATAAEGSTLIRQAEAAPVSTVSAGKTIIAEKSEMVQSTIKLVTGTYGGNCGAKPGNATDQVAHICDGQSTCDYLINPSAPGDIASICNKEFRAEWRCGNSATLYAVSVPASPARGEHLHLTCSGST